MVGILGLKLVYWYILVKRYIVGQALYIGILCWLRLVY